jgi:Fe2+ or Zn2+ uptake regulation protein
VELGFDALLRRLRLKVTPRRLAVLEVMSCEVAFLSAEQIWGKVRGRISGIGLPTVYRILEELASSGTVTRVIHGNRQLYYYFCPNEKHHHHFVCISCRKVEDIDLCLEDALKREVDERIKGTLLSHIIQLQGLCRQCTSEEHAK